MATETLVRLRLTVDLDVVPAHPGATAEELRHVVSTAMRWAMRGGHAGFDVAALNGMRVELVPDDPPMSPQDAAAYRIGRDAARAMDAILADVQAPEGYLRCPACGTLMPSNRLVCLTCLHRR
jgi:hypothetical protein